MMNSYPQGRRWSSQAWPRISQQTQLWSQPEWSGDKLALALASYSIPLHSW